MLFKAQTWIKKNAQIFGMILSINCNAVHEVGTSNWAPASTKRHTEAFLDADSQSIALAPRTEDFDAGIYNHHAMLLEIDEPVISIQRLALFNNSTKLYVQ